MNVYIYRYTFKLNNKANYLFFAMVLIYKNFGERRSSEECDEILRLVCESINLFNTIKLVSKYIKFIAI